MRLIVTELLLSILRKAGVGGPYSADALFTDIKRKISRVLAAAILLAFVNLWISTAIYVMVAILIPSDRRNDNVFWETSIVGLIFTPSS